MYSKLLIWALFLSASVYGAPTSSIIGAGVIPQNSEPVPDTLELRSSNDHHRNPIFMDPVGSFVKTASFDPSASYLGSNFQFPSSGLYSGLNTEHQTSLPSKNSFSENPDLLSSNFRRYDVKKYLLKKILGNSHDLDEDEDNFFSNKHLKRHGTAGVAAKVIGELIGIKIRESIEGIGKSFSEYAKDFTARGFVNLGQLFGRVFKTK